MPVPRNGIAEHDFYGPYLILDMTSRIPTQPSAQVSLDSLFEIERT